MPSFGLCAKPRDALLVGRQRIVNNRRVQIVTLATYQGFSRSTIFASLPRSAV